MGALLYSLAKIDLFPTPTIFRLEGKDKVKNICSAIASIVYFLIALSVIIIRIQAMLTYEQFSFE